MAATPAELYNAVLVDTPLAPFFVDCISEQDLDEMNIEIIRNTLYKAYLEAFYDFCKEIGGTTADCMCEILAVSIWFKVLRRPQRTVKVTFMLTVTVTATNQWRSLGERDKEPKPKNTRNSLQIFTVKCKTIC